MHVQNDDLLQAIIEQPDDDQLRLVYADWLEEHGDSARAEFVRLQIEYGPMCWSDPRVTEVRQRWDSLLKAHIEDWLAGFPAWLRSEFRQGTDQSYDGCTFSRGFVDEVCNTVEVVARDLDRLARQAPLSEITLIGDDDSGLPALLQSASMSRIQRLNWWGYEYGPLHQASHLTQWLTQAVPVPGLKHLLLAWVHVGGEGARHLARAAFLGSLKTLYIGRARLGDTGAATLSGASHLAQLKTLELVGNEIGDVGLAGLAAATGMPQLQALKLEWNEIGDPGVQALAESPFLHQLQVLELECNRIGDAGVVALAGSPLSRSLRRLHLGDNPFTEVGARALAESPYLDRIEHLSVHGIYSWKADKLPRSACDMLVQRFGDRVHV